MEAELAAHGKYELLRAVHDVIPKHVNCIFIRQHRALGLDHAVLCAQPVVQNEPFAVILADDLIDAEPPVIKQMIDVFATHRCSVLGVQEVSREHTGQYGIINTTNLAPSLELVHGLVEKPRPEDTLSTSAIIGCYILTSRIFHHLAQVQAGADGEIQLTDGIVALLQEEKLLVYRFSGTRYDCGSKLGYIKAQTAFGLMHADFHEEFAAYMATLL